MLAAGFRVITVDHLGFGLSDKQHDIKQNQVIRHAERFIAFMNYLNLSNVTLVVQDWGGPIGMLWAVRNPSKVGRLVILDTILVAQPQRFAFWPFALINKMPIIFYKKPKVQRLLARLWSM